MSSSSHKAEDYITTNIRVLSVNDIYTTHPLPLASSNIIAGAAKSVNLPEKLLDPTQTTQFHESVPLVLPIGGLDILRTVFDQLSTNITHDGNQVTPTNTISFLNGDILGGSLFAEHFKGESMCELLNTINPTVIGIGNHEYDYGTPQFEDLMGKAQFAWLGENMTITEDSVDSDGNKYTTRPHLHVPPCIVLDFVVKEDDDDEEVNGDDNCHNNCSDLQNNVNNHNDVKIPSLVQTQSRSNRSQQQPTPIPTKKTNATIVGRYRNVILEMLLAKMLRGRCDINDYSRFLQASAENYQNIKETLPLGLSNGDDNDGKDKKPKKPQQYYLYRVGIFSVCTQFTPNLSFPSPNTKFENPEIYALLISLLLKTIGCHSIFLVSHLSLAGDMKIAELSRQFTRMLQSYTRNTTSTETITMSSMTSPTNDNTLVDTNHPQTNFHYHNDPNSLHSSYTLIDTIYGGHEHEPIVMQYTEFDRSGIVVDESGGDGAQAQETAQQQQLPITANEPSLDSPEQTSSMDDADLQPPSLEHIASLRAPQSPFIVRENISYDAYDGPVVVKAGMNNQYTAICDYTIHIPRHACVNRLHHGHGESTRDTCPQDPPCPINQNDKDEKNDDDLINKKINTTATSLTINTATIPVCQKLMEPILFHDNEYAFTLHSDIVITFNIIAHLITTTFLQQRASRRVTPYDYLTSIFKPFEKSPIYMSYLQEIITRVKQDGTNINTSLYTPTPGTTPRTSTPGTASSTLSSQPSTPAMSLNGFMLPTPTASPVPSLGIGVEFLDQSKERFSDVHKELILPHFSDVLSRIHDNKKFQQLLDVFNETLEETMLNEIDEALEGGDDDPKNSIPVDKKDDDEGEVIINEIAGAPFFTDDNDVIINTDVKIDDIKLNVQPGQDANSQVIQANKPNPFTFTKKSTKDGSSSGKNFLQSADGNVKNVDPKNQLPPPLHKQDSIITTNKDHQFSEDLPSPTVVMIENINGIIEANVIDANTKDKVNIFERGNDDKIYLDRLSELAENDPYLSSSIYIETALRDGIMPIPIAHQSDFALSPMHYIQFHNHTRVTGAKLKDADDCEDISQIEPKHINQGNVPEMINDDDKADQSKLVVHRKAATGKSTLHRYVNEIALDDKNDQDKHLAPIVHHPTHVYTKFSMYLLPNIQLPSYFPPKLIQQSSSCTGPDPKNHPKAPLIPNNIINISFPSYGPSTTIVQKWSKQLQQDIAQGRDLEQIICHLNGSFDTRSQYGRTQGGVTGPNAASDAMEWWGYDTSQRIIQYQNELIKFVERYAEKHPEIVISKKDDKIIEVDVNKINNDDIPPPPPHLSSLSDSFSLPKDDDSGNNNGNNNNGTAPIYHSPSILPSPNNIPLPSPPEWSELSELLLQPKNKIKGVISVINGGFLRGDKYYPNGSNITLGDILNELPFPKTTLHVLMYGCDIVRAINQQLTLLPTATGAFPHFSQNVKIEYTTLPLPHINTTSQPLNTDTIKLGNNNNNGYVPLQCSDGIDAYNIAKRRFDDDTNPFYVRGSGNTTSNSTSSNSSASSSSNSATTDDNSNAAKKTEPLAAPVQPLVLPPPIPQRIISVYIDGKPIESDGLYFVTSTQFILWGGDGLTSFLRGRLVPHIDPLTRNKVIGEIVLDWFAMLKKHFYAKSQQEDQNQQPFSSFILTFTPSKRVTMHRRE